MAIVLRVRIIASTDFKDACRETIALSSKLGVLVEFDFNGLGIIVREGSDIIELEKTYKVYLERPRG